MPQMLLFPDPRPLVERLGAEFFRQLPESPGVYLMRDAIETVLYVGKAKNLRQRLGHYRVANPERMPRRHLRLLRQVSRIELEECADEEAALKRESDLLLELKPRFNRAGTWPGSPWFLAWRRDEFRIELRIVEQVEEGWNAFGPHSRRYLTAFRAVLARLVWGAQYPDRGLAQMPPGWVHGPFGNRTTISFEASQGRLLDAVSTLLTKELPDLRVFASSPAAHAFEAAARQADLEILAEFLGLELPQP